MKRFFGILLLIMVLCLLSEACWNLLRNVFGIPDGLVYGLCIVSGGLIGWNGDVIWDKIFGKESE